jgi:hypothetical protein
MNETPPSVEQRERAERLMGKIAEEVQQSVSEEANWPDGVGVEFFEPLGDWRALVAEWHRLKGDDAS